MGRARLDRREHRSRSLSSRRPPGSASFRFFVSRALRAGACRILAGALFGIVAAALLAAAPAYAQSTPTTVWSTTLTASVADNDEGCDNFDSDISNCSSALGEDEFTYEGVTYTIVSLYRYDVNGSLYLVFDKDIDDNLKSMTLHVGSNTYAIGSGTIFTSSPKQVIWGLAPALVNAQQYTVKLTLVDTTGPAVSAIAVTSSPPATQGGYYKAGDKIAVTVTFNEAIVVTGSPRLKIKVGTAEKNATCAAHSSENTKLVCSYTVASGDEDTDGIAVERNKLSRPGSATIKDSSNNNATLTYAAALALGNQSAHKVDTVAPAAPGGFAASAGIGGARLTWSAPSTADATIAKYQYRQKAGTAAWGSWTDVAGGAAARARTVTGLMSGTAYRFQLRAVDAATNAGASSAAGPVTPLAVGTGAPAGQTVAAGWALIPKDSDNNPLVAAGGKFRLLFVTSGTTTATSTSISTYNAFVQRAARGNANLRSFATQFRAVVSTSTIDARDNTATTGTGVPIYWVQGARVANDYADFYDGSWDSYAGKLDTGSNTPSTLIVFTGSDDDGTKDSLGPAGGDGSASGRTLCGSLAAGPLRVAGYCFSSSAAPLYGLSPVLTVSGQTVTDTTRPTVTASATGYYSDAALSNALTGTQAAGTNIYTKVTFSEDMSHVKSDGAAARPQLFHRIGTTDTQYDILDNGDTLASGDCKPNHATNTNVYVCLYTVGSSDSGAFAVKAGTASADKANNALATAYTHAATLTLGSTGSTVPARLTGLTATAGDRQVTLTWDDPNDASITKYQVWHRPQAQRTGGSGWVDVPGAVTSYTVTGLQNGTEYQFWIRAVNDIGHSGTEIAYATPVPVPATEAPAKPRIHQVTTGIRRITIYLMPPNDPTIQKYQVALSPNTQSFKDIPGSNADSSVLIVTVPENKEYDFTIRAVNSFGPGPWLLYQSVTPGFPTADGKTVLGVDVWGFTVTPGEGQLGLTWNARHPGVCGYVIEWRESTGTNTWGPWKQHQLGSAAHHPTHTITGLKEGTKYQVRVYVSSGRYSIPNGLAFSSEGTTTGTSTLGMEQQAPEEVSVAPPPAPDPLTATFENAPAEHKGTGKFTVQVAFSEAVARGAKAAAQTIQVAGGTLARARRAGGAADRWSLDIRPSGHGAVTVTLPATTDCAAAGAVCTADGRRLASAVSHTVQGPPGLSVADARAKERVNETIDFRVTLSRAAAHEVTVRYATRDGTAKKGKDYRKAKGTLTFAPGETAKTVAVAIIDDALNENLESFRLVLSGAKGAYIADGEATGQVVNSDPMPDAWLARFGRTVAIQAVDAVTDRLEGGGGSHMTLGGQTVSLDSLQGRADAKAELDAVAAALGAGRDDAADRDAWMRGERTAASSRTMTGRELLLGSSFHLASGGEAGGPAFAAWGRVAHGSFDGDADGLTLDGAVTTGFLGADMAARGWLAGVALSRSQGKGSYRDHAVAEEHADRGTGDVESSLTSVLPYARIDLSERVTVWGMAGYGAGELVLTEKTETGTDRHTTDLTMTLGAIGGRGTLVPAPEGGGFTLALKTDAFWVRTQADAARSDAGNLAASDTDATRLRVALDASRPFALGGGTLTPSLEVGLRHDGGDAETGTGVEFGAGLRYEGDGIAVAGSARWLVAHEAAGYEEWGASGSVRIDPGDSGRGLSLTLAPTVGNAASGTGNLWSAADARGLAPGTEFEAARRLDAEVGYGLAMFGGRFTGTPHAGVSLSDGARAYRLGWRLTSAVRGDPGFEIGLDATRSESANDNAPEHGAMLRATVRW